MTAPSQVPQARAWSPSAERAGAWGSVSIVAWTGLQPLLQGYSRTPAWLTIVICVLGNLVIVAALLRFRYVRAAPYRATLAAARAARPDSVVYGVQLDPIATPVGEEWADSRAITWGLIIASPTSLEIVKNDGTEMLDQPWSGVKFALEYRTRLFVTVDEVTEEWWVPLISESGAWPMGFGRRPVERRILQMLAVGGMKAPDGSLSV
jgi:hypothetical protein